MKFYAEWCAPCKMLSKTLEEFMESVDKNIVDISSFDIDNSHEHLMDKWNVRSVPTLILVNMKTGVEVERKYGNLTKQELSEWLKNHIDILN